MAVEHIDDRSTLKNSYWRKFSLELIEFMKNRNWVRIGCFHAAALRWKKERRRSQLCHVNHVRKAGRQPGAAQTSPHIVPLTDIRHSYDHRHARLPINTSTEKSHAALYLVSLLSDVDHCGDAAATFTDPLNFLGKLFFTPMQKWILMNILAMQKLQSVANTQQMYDHCVRSFATVSWRSVSFLRIMLVSLKWRFSEEKFSLRQ